MMPPLTERLLKAGRNHGMRPLPPGHEPSAWLRCTLGALVSRGNVGQLDVDEHLAPGDVGVVALWRPREVFCGRCIRGAQHPHGSTEDRRCDRCGAVRDTVFPYVVAAADQLLVLFGLCPRCNERELGA